MNSKRPEKKLSSSLPSSLVIDKEQHIEQRDLNRPPLCIMLEQLWKVQSCRVQHRLIQMRYFSGKNTCKVQSNTIVE